MRGKERRMSNPWVSSRDLFSSNFYKIKDKEMEDLNCLEGRKLYIWLGSDVIYSLNLDNLHLRLRWRLDMVKMVSSIPTLGTEYTQGSFFFMNSKLHYLCGGGSGPDNSNFNTEVLSFNLPSFTPDDSHFPDHSGPKPRPIVFTISNKVYALATLPVYYNLRMFDVYEPESGKWRSLPAPAIEALYTLRNHFVFRNKLILQSWYGDFIFDAVTEDWVLDTDKVFPKCCAVLEHDDLLFVITREPFKLVAYELTTSSWPNKLCLSRKVEEIEENYFEFSKLNIAWASLNLVEKDCICLLFSSNHKLHVSLFRFTKTTDKSILKAEVVDYHEFANPLNRGPHYLLYTTFLWCPEVNEHDGTKDISSCDDDDDDDDEDDDDVETRKNLLFLEKFQKSIGEGGVVRCSLKL